MSTAELVKRLSDWAVVTGNYIFLRDLQEYVKLVEQPDFQKMLERRLADDT